MPRRRRRDPRPRPALRDGLRPPAQRPPVVGPGVPAGRTAAQLVLAAAPRSTAAASEVVAVAVVQVSGLLPEAAAQLLHVPAPLAPELPHLVVEAVPGGLAADAHGIADALPGGALGHGLLDQLGFPGGEMGL